MNKKLTYAQTFVDRFCEGYKEHPEIEAIRANLIENISICEGLLMARYYTRVKFNLTKKYI